jgi:hypothetical protein
MELFSTAPIHHSLSLQLANQASQPYPLTILSSSNIHALLLQLTKQDILALQQSSADALYYSTATVEGDDDSKGCCEAYQSKGTSMKNRDGAKMDDLPACSDDGVGARISTLLSGALDQSVTHNKKMSSDKKAPMSLDTESVISSLDGHSLSPGSISSMFIQRLV